MRKPAIYTRLVVAWTLVLVATSCGPSPAAAFDKASEYWRGLKGPGYIEASVLAPVITPMSNQAGVHYLIDKMDNGVEGETEIAALCLAIIYEILLDSPSEESRRLRDPIEKSKLLELAAVYANKGSNEAIRHTLAVFVKRPKKEAATPSEVRVSGAETWMIGGRRYKIHDTRINMRHPKGPMFTVVLDQSRGVVARTINPIIEIPPADVIAKYAFDHGYFGKAQDIRLVGEKIPLQNRMAVYVGRKTGAGFGAIGSTDGEFSLQNLGKPENGKTADRPTEEEPGGR